MEDSSLVDDDRLASTEKSPKMADAHITQPIPQLNDQICSEKSKEPEDNNCTSGSESEGSSGIGQKISKRGAKQGVAFLLAQVNRTYLICNKFFIDTRSFKHE